MFPTLIVKPQAKTVARSSDVSALRRATTYGHDQEIEQAQTSRPVLQSATRCSHNVPFSSRLACSFEQIVQ